MVALHPKRIPARAGNLQVSQLYQHDRHDYVPAVDRFLLPQWAYVDLDAADPWRQTFFHLYEAPKPWGPWSLIHVEPDFGHSWYNPSLPAKWFEDGGRRMWMVCGGDFAQRRSKETTPSMFGNWN